MVAVIFKGGAFGFFTKTTWGVGALTGNDVREQCGLVKENGDLGINYGLESF